MKEQPVKVWEWQDAPQAVRDKAPAYDDVSFLVLLPRWMSEVPGWVETLVFPGGGGDEWKCVLAEPIEGFAEIGQILVAVCHA